MCTDSLISQSIWLYNFIFQQIENPTIVVVGVPFIRHNSTQTVYKAHYHCLEKSTEESLNSSFFGRVLCVSKVNVQADENFRVNPVTPG